jgi:hypothetical protein
MIRATGSRARSQRFVWLMAAPLLVLVGCATRPVIPQAPKPPAAAVREQLGRIAVVARSGAPAIRMQVPVSRKNAAKDAAMHVGLAPLVVSAMSGAGVLAPPVLLGSAVWAPVGLTLGGAYGAAVGESEDRIVAATGQLNEAADASRFGLLLRGALITAIAPHADAVPGASGFAYTALASDGVDTVLEVEIIELALAGNTGFNSALNLQVDVLVRLVATGDGSEVWSDHLLYRSPERRTFAKWAGPPAGASPLRAEFDHAARSIGEEIVTQIFTRAAPGDTKTAVALARRGVVRVPPLSMH